MIQAIDNLFRFVGGVGCTAGAVGVGYLVGNSLGKDLTQDSWEVKMFKEAESTVVKVGIVVATVFAAAIAGGFLGMAISTIPCNLFVFHADSFATMENISFTLASVGETVGFVAGAVFAFNVARRANEGEWEQVDTDQ